MAEARRGQVLRRRRDRPDGRRLGRLRRFDEDARAQRIPRFSLRRSAEVRTEQALQFTVILGMVELGGFHNG